MLYQTASQNPFSIPPPLPDSFLSSSTTYQSQPNIGNNPIHQSSPEPTVALSGCTAADGDVVPNQSPNPSTSAHHTPPSPPTASQNPFIIPHPLPDSFLSSSTTYQSQPNNDNNQVPNPNPPPNNDNDPIQDRWSSVFSDTISWDVFSNQCKKLSEDVIKTSQEKQPKKASADPGVHFDLQHAPLITTELRSGITHGKLERYKQYTVYQRSVRLGRS